MVYSTLLPTITADAHTSAASSRLNWPPPIKRTRPFRRKTKAGYCACVIAFQLASTASFSGVCSCFQEILYFHINLFIYSKRIVCFLPRDRRRALHAKFFLYRRRNVQAALDTGGGEWVVTGRRQRIRETSDVSLLLQGHGFLKRWPASQKIKHSSFSDKLSAFFTRCQKPTAKRQKTSFNQSAPLVSVACCIFLPI
jgi:hypothetical protein